MNKACKILLLVGGIFAFSSIMFYFLILIIIAAANPSSSIYFNGEYIPKDIVYGVYFLIVLFSIPCGILSLISKNRRNYPLMIICMCLAILSLNFIVLTGAIFGLVVISHNNNENNIATDQSN